MSVNLDKCWLNHIHIDHSIQSYAFSTETNLSKTLEQELTHFFAAEKVQDSKEAQLFFEMKPLANLGEEGFRMEQKENQIIITAATSKGWLYGFYHLLRLFSQGKPVVELESIPDNRFRMVNHWDNMDGSIERGYAGDSIFFRDNQFREDWDRVREYARLLASVSINALTINNVNVHQVETYLIREPLLSQVAKAAEIFRSYGIKLFLSINYAAPIEMGELTTADPLDETVQAWWQQAADTIYAKISDFGGFVVKADSENRPGPFTYGRNHADGANMLGRAIAPYQGVVFWRCFVYDNHQDWRNRTIDRARAAYDHFAPLDGEFLDNVVLQIKNGPMDFQVREAVSPLFGALKKTNQILEFQITQEYTGQQKHIFYLVPLWKEVLDFDTHAEGEGSTIQKVLNRYPEHPSLNGITAVTNVGLDNNWTGHKLSQANFYGFGRLGWDASLTAEEILEEWIAGTFTLDDAAKEVLKEIMMTSRYVYEEYTSPLGIGWMVEPNHHYGPNIDGYEYSMWGTYHFSDRNGLGVDRTVATGTGYTSQYYPENFEKYEHIETCPDELLLFFHHVPYTHVLKSGKTVIQHIYDTHFVGVEAVKGYQEKWESLKGQLAEEDYENVRLRLIEQMRCATEWRDQVNTYYYRKSGVVDEKNRIIYP
ncbi:alpha-glucuronidase [Jeotgalibaca caeni]|uniref:alpha-glucuronidase n=1 Tax=Jeotgalibaca caeni TaxID=3028623 RepID=UPI00237DA1E9|nr:alpha-glucuronidase [Jeotgalibaca caeni]MDE1548934.1 alpha-glucuronidase [Jeotgalibaca caeni]